MKTLLDKYKIHYKYENCSTCAVHCHENIQCRANMPRRYIGIPFFRTWQSNGMGRYWTSARCVLSSTGVKQLREVISDCSADITGGQWPWYHGIWIALVCCRWWSWRLLLSSEAPTAAAAEISATDRMTEDHSIVNSIIVKVLFIVRGLICLVCIMEIKVLLYVRGGTILPGQEPLPGSPVLPQLLLPVPRRSCKEESDFWGWKVFPHVTSSCWSFQAE